MVMYSLMTEWYGMQLLIMFQMTLGMAQSYLSHLAVERKLLKG